MRFSLHVDLESLNVNDEGKLLGQMHAVFGDERFPAADWFDFAGVVVSRWLLQLAKLARHETVAVTIPFVAGPYQVYIEATQGTLVELQAFDSSMERIGSSVATMPLPELLLAAIDVARTMLAECERRDFRATASSELRQCLRAAEACL